MNKLAKYEKELHTLQIELLKLQDHVKANGLKVVVLFEGRDASGKGGTIKRVTEHLNPRGCKVVALEKPTEVESTQWYFQRYIQHLPSAGQIVLFDRSWYNRAGVEPVMGFCSEEEYTQFLTDVPQFEKMLVASGIILLKFYFSVSKEVQNERFESRKLDHLKQYKISPVDLNAQGLWDEYTEAKRIMLSLTDTLFSHWTIIKSDNKRKARVNCIKHILRNVDYPDKLELKISNKILFTGTEELNNMKSA
jgi:polyphosphate kinase 2